MAQQQNLQHVNIHHILEKLHSKKELYNFLTLDCKIYMPQLRSTNVYFYKQILKGQKKSIDREKVKVSQIPHLEGLTVQDLLDYARTKPEIVAYLPDEKDWVHLDRQWLGDVLYTVDTRAVDGMIRHALEERKQKNEQNKDELVDMKPEFAQALERCISFSNSSKGKSAYLLKNHAKRRRTKEEVKEVKGEELKLKEDRQQFLKEHQHLKAAKDQLEQQMLALIPAQQIVEQLQQQNIIDDYGNLREDLNQ